MHKSFWGKLLLKVRHNNIVLLPKKQLVTFLPKVLRYLTFSLLIKSALGLWFVFNIKYFLGKCKSLFTPKVK